MKQYVWRVSMPSGRNLAQGETDHFMDAVTACNQHRWAHGSKQLVYGIVDTTTGALVWPVDKKQSRVRGKKKPDTPTASPLTDVPGGES